jgi:NAD(P)H-hydrate epimerase
MQLALSASAVVAGPGLGQSDDVSAIVGDLVAATEAPLVLDADALNSLARRPESLSGRKEPTVLTPHPGEFARLSSCDTATVQAGRRERAVEFARRHGVILVLKGAGTIVTDGHCIYTNTTGNPGMATGGTGDVLSGLLGALLAGRALEPFDAAVLAVYLHGLAGDLARDDLGETSLVASDLLDYLPGAFRRHAQAPPP